mmetsp:Transcript_32505/g.81466  ORF Transcript_32505/g.81466 Transcript_32505/m.81466 type:complete len:385 (+) Transcript_32505:1635-2789(+)
MKQRKQRNTNEVSEMTRSLPEVVQRKVSGGLGMLRSQLPQQLICSACVCVCVCVCARARPPSAVLQGNARHGLVVAGVRADGLSGGKVPQLGCVVGRRCDKVCRIGGEHSVPHPPLVAHQRFGVRELQAGADRPQLDRVVGRRGGKRLPIGGVETPQHILVVGSHLVCLLKHRGVLLSQLPQEARPRVVGSAATGPVGCNDDRPDGNLSARLQLPAAFIGCKVPHTNVPILVATNQFGLVWVEADSVHGSTTVVVPLTSCCPQVPYLHGAILTPRKHPLAVPLEANSSDVACVPIVACDRRRIVAVDLVQSHIGVARRCDVLLVWCDLKPVDLRFLELNLAVTDSTGRLPKPNGVVVGGSGKDDRRHGGSNSRHACTGTARTEP